MLQSIQWFWTLQSRMLFAQVDLSFLQHLPVLTKQLFQTLAVRDLGKMIAVCSGTKTKYHLCPESHRKTNLTSSQIEQMQSQINKDFKHKIHQATGACYLLRLYYFQTFKTWTLIFVVESRNEWRSWWM